MLVKLTATAARLAFFRPWATLALLLAALLAVSPADAEAAGASGKRPDFSGDWVLDAKRSDDPAAKMRELRAARGDEGRGGRGGGGRGPGAGMGGPGGRGPGGRGPGGRGPGGRGPGGGQPPGEAGPGSPPRLMMLPDQLKVDHQNGMITYRGPEFPSQIFYTDGRVATRDTPRGQFELEAAWGQGDRLEVTYRPTEPPVQPAEPAAGISTGGPVKEGDRAGRRAMPPPREVWELIADGQRLLITTEVGPLKHRVTIARVYNRAP